MPHHINRPRLDIGHILLAQRRVNRAAGDDSVFAGMRFERAHCRHQHNRVRPQTRNARLDVKKLFSPNIGPKSRFSNHIIAALHGDHIGDNRRIAVRDIGERPRMNQRRRIL